MKYKLHCFAQSGNAYKVALMLNLCGADWEAVFVDFFNGEHRSEEFRALNEFAEVPVLEAGELVLSSPALFWIIWLIRLNPLMLPAYLNIGRLCVGSCLIIISSPAQYRLYVF